MEDQFFEESLKAVRSSFRNMILAIIASMSLFTFSMSDPEFERIVQFGKDLLSFENKSPLLAIQFDAFRKQSDSLTTKKFADPIEQLTSSMELSGYLLNEMNVRTLKSYSPAPTFEKKVTVNGSQETRYSRAVLPTDLDFWLNEFPHIVDLNHYYQQPKPDAEVSLLKPYTTTWTGCQKTVNFSPSCEGSQRPEGLLSGIGTSGTVSSLGIWLEYKLEKPTQCTPTKNVQTTTYNYPKLSCEWSELPESSYRSAAQKIGAKYLPVCSTRPAKKLSLAIWEITKILSH